MSDLKTKQTEKSVDKFIEKIEDPEKQKASKQILEILKDISKEKAILWEILL